MWNKMASALPAAEVSRNAFCPRITLSEQEQGSEKCGRGPFPIRPTEVMTLPMQATGEAAERGGGAWPYHAVLGFAFLAGGNQTGAINQGPRRAIGMVGLLISNQKDGVLLLR